MNINANTKIATILKGHPDALEAIVSVSSKFEKLRNPILRKLMAGRTTIAMASKIGQCSIDDFFTRLRPLGFEIDKEISPVANHPASSKPGLIEKISRGKIIELDVRPILENGNDPLTIILQKVRSLKEGEVLKIVSSFVPTPLVNLLEKQGYESHVEMLSEELINTYFSKTEKVEVETKAVKPPTSGDWDGLLHRYNNSMLTIDVRHLEMPQPMMTILQELEHLPKEKALFVYHKRIPVFLLAELDERNFSFRIKEISDNEVHLIIFRQENDC